MQGTINAQPPLAVTMKEKAMGRPRNVTSTDLQRAMKVAVAYGLAIEEVIIEPGSVRLRMAGPQLPVEEVKTGVPRNWEEFE
jgi:hypothetical protein